MSELVQQVQAELLSAKGLDAADISGAIDQMLGRNVDYGEVYIQSGRSESFGLEDGIVKDGSFAVDAGIGVRALAGEKTGFAYCEDIRKDGLSKAAAAAKAVAASGSRGPAAGLAVVSADALYSIQDPIVSLSQDQKVALLQQVDKVARAEDPRVKEVNVRIAANHSSMLVMASDGTLSADIRPLVRLDVSVIVEEKGRRERGNAGGGGRTDLSAMAQGDRAENLAREAVRMALVNLQAIDAPAGPMPVVLGPGWPGVLLHEAVGHGLEGDFNRKKTSAFYDLVGKSVASDQITIVDDGTIPNRRGSLTIDDEGTKSQNTVLIEKGKLKGFMHDRLNARLMKQSPTGNGRRQSYSHIPMPRMTNTYMLPGKYEHDELIKSTKKGIYATQFSGGQVDITSGKFVFSASEAFEIINGKIGKPLKGATLIGNGPDILKQVTMVGNNLELDNGIGTCGKEGQMVPVGVGQPSLKIKKLTVGGTV